MPLSSTEISDLKADVKKAMANDMDFFFCEGDENDNPALVIGKSISTQLREMRAKSKSNKFVVGKVGSNGGVLEFRPKSGNVTRLIKELPKYFKRISDLASAVVVEDAKSPSVAAVEQQVEAAENQKTRRKEEIEASPLSANAKKAIRSYLWWDDNRDGVKVAVKNPSSKYLKLLTKAYERLHEFRTEKLYKEFTDAILSSDDSVLTAAERRRFDMTKEKLKEIMPRIETAQQTIAEAQQKGERQSRFRDAGKRVMAQNEEFYRNNPEAAAKREAFLENGRKMVEQKRSAVKARLKQAVKDGKITKEQAKLALGIEAIALMHGKDGKGASVGEGSQFWTNFGAGSKDQAQQQARMAGQGGTVEMSGSGGWMDTSIPWDMLVGNGIWSRNEGIAKNKEKIESAAKRLEEATEGTPEHDAILAELATYQGNIKSLMDQLKSATRLQCLQRLQAEGSLPEQYADFDFNGIGEEGAKYVWDMLSIDFAAGARGRAHFTAPKGTEIDPEKTWASIEKPILDALGVTVDEHLFEQEPTPPTNG